MFKSTTWLTLSLLCLSVFSKAQTPWELREDKEGIQIYTRELPNKKYLEFKATTEIEASMHSLIALLKSVDQMSDWMKNFEQNKLLASKDFWHQVSYHEVYIPILQNRDVVLELKVSKNASNGEVRIDMLGLPSYLPYQKKKTRIQEMKGYWVCVPLDEQRIRIEYGMYVDPGSSIPSWLYNMRIKKDPFTTLKNIQAIVKESAFKDAYYTELVEQDNR